MMGTRIGSGPLDEDFERGIDVLRAAYAKKVNNQEAEISHLKNELARRDSRIKDLQVKIVQLEGQLVKGDKKIQELTRAVNKLNNFKQTVMESFADVADDLPADFSAKQKGMMPNKNAASHPKDELDLVKEEPSSIRHVASPSVDSLRFQRFEEHENSPKKSGGYLGQSSGEDVLNNIQHLSAPSSPSKITGPAGRDNGSHDEDGDGEQATMPHGRSAVTIGIRRPRRLERSMSRQGMPAVEDLPSSTTAMFGKPPPLRNRSPSVHHRRESSLPRRSPTPTASSARRHSTPASTAKPALRHNHHHYHHENYTHDMEYDSSNAANDSSTGGGGGAGGDAGCRSPLSGSGGGGGGAASVDGREFFRMARGVLSYDEFTNLLWNVKAYNNREQSRQRTFDALHQLFGRKHPELFTQFEKMWNQ